MASPSRCCTARAAGAQLLDLGLEVRPVVRLVASRLVLRQQQRDRAAAPTPARAGLLATAAAGAHDRQRREGGHGDRRASACTTHIDVPPLSACLRHVAASSRHAASAHPRSGRGRSAPRIAPPRPAPRPARRARRATIATSSAADGIARRRTASRIGSSSTRRLALTRRPRPRARG